MSMILSSMLLLTLIGGILTNKNGDIPIHDTSNKPVEEIVEDTIKSYKGTISDEYNVPSEVMNLIINYMDNYYSSLAKLELQDMSSLFNNPLALEISNRAIDLLINTRKLYDFDFSFNNAHYDLKVTDYNTSGNIYKVSLLEDDTFSFNFLEGIESKTFDVENYFEIEKVNDEYKIKDLDKIQGYYIGFHDDVKTLSDAGSVYDYYYSQLKELIEYTTQILKPRSARDPYLYNIPVENKYDRQAAVAYSDLYYHERNKEWYNFTDEGGNCQNYASQSMYAGGIPMDFLGEEQWKCFIEDPDFDPEINEAEVKEGRSASWVHVGSFYSYAFNNSGYGMICDPDVNIYYAEPGDLILVGNGEVAHTVIVSKVVDGHILVNSNSIDMKDYPIEAFTYTTVKLVKILGSN